MKKLSRRTAVTICASARGTARCARTDIGQKKKRTIKFILFMCSYSTVANGERASLVNL